MSYYVGAYAYAYSNYGNSAITVIGLTLASNAAHVIANNVATNCSVLSAAVASSTSYGSGSTGSNAYGACADPRCFVS